MTVGFIEITILALYFVCKRSTNLINLSISTIHKNMLFYWTYFYA
jgi:hypothetical protein